MRNPRAAILLLLVLTCVGALDARTAESPKFSTKTWQTDDGLPHNMVLALAQPDDGYLWVGTQQGLVRFNGTEFLPVDDPAAPHLLRGRITALCNGSEGTLWIGCDGFGVSSLHDGVFHHYTLSNGLPSLEIRCLAEDPSGGVWVGTENGLARIKDGRARVYTVADGLIDNSIRSLAFDSSGQLQIATKRGLATRELDGNFLVRTFPGRWNVNALRAVCGSRNQVWAGSTDGLHRIEGGAVKTYNVDDGLPDRIVNWLWADPFGRIWVGTYGGLVLIEDGRVMRLGLRETMADEMVNIIYEDRERSIWVGTRDGLLRIVPSRFVTYRSQSGLSGNNVMSVLEDSKGAMWLGIWGGGIDVMNRGKVTTLRSQIDLSRDSVLSLVERRNGEIWAGMDFNLGLNVVTNGVRYQRPIPGVITGPVRALLEDRGGEMWVGTDQGLLMVREDGTVKTYTTNNGLAGNVVRVLQMDAKGAIWAGTDQGLNRIQNGAVAGFNQAKGFTNAAINALFLDASNELWIGTLSMGLFRFRAGEFNHCGVKDGLFSDEIYEIIEDDFGFFWLSCRSGLFRVSKRQIEDFFAGRGGPVSSTVFGRADGLLSVQFNGVAKPAGWKDHAGRLWFASIRGVVEVDPSVPTNERPPPVVIEKVMADRETAWAAGITAGRQPEIRIPPGTGQIEIYFSALSLQVPEKNLFSYTLEGADSGWTEPGNQRMARYNKLPPGNYKFHVRASNSDGTWNRQGAAVVLRVLPRFWQTWPFRIMVLCTGLVLAWLAYHARVSRIRELEALRIGIAANLHDEVGARLTKVAMITEHVTGQVPAAHAIRPGVEAIGRATSEVTRAMDEVVWTINPKNDTVENLANYMFQYTQEYLQDTGVHCLLDFPPQLPDRELSTGARHHLFMILKEGLNNVLKHSKATEVRVTLGADDTRLQIEIKDNGCGFDFDRAQRSGDGLSNMRQRAAQIGADITWQTRPGEGTLLRIVTYWT